MALLDETDLQVLEVVFLDILGQVVDLKSTAQDRCISITP